MYLNSATQVTSKKYSVQWVVYVRFEVLMAVLRRIQVFWSVMLCCWVSGHLHCEGLYCLRLQKKSRWLQRYVCTSNCWNKEGSPHSVCCVLLSVIHLCIQLVVEACQYQYSKSLQFSGFMFSKSPVSVEKITSEVQTSRKEWGCEVTQNMVILDYWSVNVKNICVGFYQNVVGVLGWKLSVIQKRKSVC